MKHYHSVLLPVMAVYNPKVLGNLLHDTTRESFKNGFQKTKLGQFGKLVFGKL